MMLKRIYVIELHNIYPEYQEGFRVAILANCKEEAEILVSQKYPKYKIESTELIKCNDIIL